LSSFGWLGNPDVFQYTNWAVGFPSNDSSSTCVQISSALFSSEYSKWRDVPCLKRNIPVCQKTRNVPPDVIQRIVFEMYYNQGKSLN
jgi:lectin-like protein